MAIMSSSCPTSVRASTEAEIVAWKVKVGDTVEINDIVVEIETAKSLVELPVAVRRHRHGAARAEGETVDVGTPIISIGDGRGAAPADRAGAAGRRPSRGAARPLQPLPPPVAARARAWSAATRPSRRARGPVGLRAPSDRGRRRPDAGAGRLRARGAQSQARRPRPPVPGRRPALAAAPPPSRSADRGPAPAPRTSGALAKPPVRKLAKDLGVDLAARHPSGAGRHRSPATTSQAAAVREAAHAPTRRRRARRIPCAVRRGRARDPRADQGRPQDDGAGDGRLGVHRPARHRVGHRRRHRDDGARRAAQGSAASSATSRSRRCSCSPRAVRPGDAAHPGDQLVLGRGRPGGRLQALRQPRHRGGHAARPGRAQRQGRRTRPVDARAGARRSASSPRPPARAGRSRPR